jgi:5-methylcytosine-specific restriction endonuclease McrA
MSSNKYMAEYMKKRYDRRRLEAIELLGGKCVLCGSVENLEFDHLNPEEKSFSIGDRLAEVAKDKLELELKKCQLLCSSCHDDKHKQKQHGNLSMFRYCKCELCRKANSDYSRKWKRENRKKS